MYPDEKYAEGRGSFLRPVSPPFHEVTESPTKAVTVSCFWLPYIRGALQQLLLQATWATDDPAVLLLAQQRAFELIDLFNECSTSDLPFSCPYDWPFTDQEGWSAPAWLTAFGYVPGSIGTFQGAGLGWRDSDSVSAGGPRQVRGITIDHDYSPDITVTSVDFEYILDIGTATDCPGGLNFDVALFNSGGSVIGDAPTPFCTVPTGLNTYHASYMTPITGVAKVRVFAFSDSLPNLTGTMDGFVQINSVTVNGVGVAAC